MITNEQLEYVKQQLQAGAGKSELQATLSEHGYSQEHISELFQALEAPTPPAAAADSVHSDQTQFTQQSQSTNTMISSEANEQAKTIAIIGYIFSFLFFLPMVMDSLKSNQFSRFHANQHLLLLILAVAYWVVSGVLVSLRLYSIDAIFSLAFGVGVIGLAIVGIINAVNGETKPLPVIGNISLLK